MILLHKRREYIYAIGAVFCWSTAATAFKIALELVDIYQLLFIATGFASLILIALGLFKFGAVELLECFHRHWKLTLLAGLINPVVYYNLLFQAYDMLPAQVALSINYSWSIVLTLMSGVVLRQKVYKVDYLVAGASYFAVVIIATQGDLKSLYGSNMIGVVIALLSTFAWAFYWILTIKDPRESLKGLCLNFIVALPLTGVTCYVFSDFEFSFEGFLAASYVGTIEMALGFLLWSSALKLSTSTSRISNLMFLSPFISLVFIRLILEENIKISTFFGLAVIIVGLLVQQRAHSRLVSKT